MVRTVLACSLAALLALTAGCRMCAHPYDYCGPTYTGAPGESCDAKARRGSILSSPTGAFTVAAADAEAVVEPADDVQRRAEAGRAQRWIARRPDDVLQR